MSPNTHIKKVFVRATAAVAAALVLAACGAEPSTAPTGGAQTEAVSSVIADHGFTGMDARQVIEKLDAMPLAERPDGLMVSIRPDRLIFSDDKQREAELAMPTDQFYLSFAPYLTKTHDCHFHSLTTCTGELQNAEVGVLVTDNATGDVIVDKQLRTFDNGFLGLWLPRDIDATLLVEYQDRTAASPITTKGNEAATCLTTLPLT